VKAADYTHFNTNKLTRSFAVYNWVPVHTWVK